MSAFFLVTDYSGSNSWYCLLPFLVHDYMIFPMGLAVDMLMNQFWDVLKRNLQWNFQCLFYLYIDIFWVFDMSLSALFCNLARTAPKACLCQHKSLPSSSPQVPFGNGWNWWTIRFAQPPQLLGPPQSLTCSFLDLISIHPIPLEHSLR